MRYSLAAFLVVAALASVGGAPAHAASGPDAAVSIAVRFNPLNFGSDETYTATVTNVGSAPATNIVLTDTLPGTTVTYLSSTISQGICSAAGRTVNCITSLVPAGATVTASITVSQSEPIGSTITNTIAAQITDAGGNPVADPTPADDSASISIPVVSNVPSVTTDVQVTGSTNQGGPKAGSPFVLTWQVRNNQDPVSDQVTFTDTLPANLTLSGPVTTSLGTCSSVGATVTCTVDNLTKSEQQVISMNVTAGSILGNVSDTGSVSFSGTDTNPANNSFTVTVKVQ